MTTRPKWIVAGAFALGFTLGGSLRLIPLKVEVWAYLNDSTVFVTTDSGEQIEIFKQGDTP